MNVIRLFLTSEILMQDDRNETATSTINAITKHEFYQAMSLVWMFLTMIIFELTRRFEGFNQIFGTAIGATAFALWMINIGQLRKIKTSLSNAKLPELSAEIQAMAADPSRKIEAIKAYREMTGLGLAEARRAVEDYLASRNRGGQS